MSADVGVWMFGLTGVGKTRMINAMTRGFEQISDSASPKAYSLYHTQSSDDLKSQPILVPISTDWEQMQATTNPYQDRYVLKIHQRGRLQQEYNIDIFDIPGGMAENQSYWNTEKDLFEKIISHTKGTLIVLDPKHRSLAPALNLMEYVSQLHQPKSASTFPFSRRVKPIYKMALCLNKVDRLNLRWRDPEKAFEIVFGADWLKITQKSQNQYVNIQIRPYLTSSLGFISDIQGKEHPNQILAKEKNIESLVYPDEWLPWNITQPLLWILMDNPDKESQQDLIPYW